MDREEYKKSLKEFDSYVNVTKKKLSGEVNSIQNRFIKLEFERLEREEKIADRNNKIDNLLEND